MELAELEAKKIGIFLKSLVKAAKILRFYPENNPMGQVAVKECLQRLVQLRLPKELTLQVTLETLLFKESPMATDYPGTQQLARQLYLLLVEELTFQSDTTESDLRMFCQLLRLDPRQVAQRKGFSNVLAQEGVEHIRVTESRPPKIVEADQVSEKLLIKMIAQRERKLHQDLAQKMVTPKLSTRPPQVVIKIGVDGNISSLSLPELNELIDDPGGLVGILSRLSKLYSKDVQEWGRSVGEKLREARELLGELDGQEKTEVFRRVSSTILRMDPENKERLIRDCLLPGLLEGREEAEILRFFSDVDLTQALGMLSQSGVSLPETFSAAVRKLHLPERRQALLLPMLKKELEKKGFQTDDIPLFKEEKRIAAIAQGQDKDQLSFLVNPGQLQDLDPVLNSQDREELKLFPRQLTKINSTTAELSCLLNLSYLEGDSKICQEFVQRISDLLEEFLYGEQWEDLTLWINRLQQITAGVSMENSSTIVLIKKMLSSLATDTLVRCLIEKYDLDKDEGRRKQYLDVLGALGELSIPVFIDFLDYEERLSVRRTVLNIMLKVTSAYVDSLSLYINHQHWYVVRNVVWLLGRFGPGSEQVIAQALSYEHLQVKKEAIRSLALIASPAAIDQIVFVLESADRVVRRIAAEYLSSLPGELLQPHLVRILSRKRFLQRDIFVAIQSLEILGKMKGPEVLKLFRRLSRWRFFFWNWKLVRVGLVARRIFKENEKNFLTEENSLR